MKKRNKKIGIKDGFFRKPIESNRQVSIFKKGITLAIYNDLGGYNLFFENKKGDFVSAIFHRGSYGAEKGLWEVMPSRNKKESVEGYLTFEEVIKWVNKSLKEK